MPNILVTGGAGNIGTNLCNELRSRGHKVIHAIFTTPNELIIFAVMYATTDNFNMFLMSWGHSILFIILQQNMDAGMVKPITRIFGKRIMLALNMFCVCRKNLVLNIFSFLPVKYTGIMMVL